MPKSSAADLARTYFRFSKALSATLVGELTSSAVS